MTIQYYVKTIISLQIN